MPSNLARRRRTIGSSIIRIARPTGGKTPEIMPTMTWGRSHIQARNLYSVQRPVTFVKIPGGSLQHTNFASKWKSARRTDECDGKYPADNQAKCSGPADQLPQPALVGVQAKVAPDDVRWRDLGVFVRHTPGHVVGQNLCGHVCGDLLVEPEIQYESVLAPTQNGECIQNEGTGQRRVLEVLPVASASAALRCRLGYCDLGFE